MSPRILTFMALLIGSGLLTQCSVSRNVTQRDVQTWAEPMVVHAPSLSQRRSYAARALALTNVARRKHGCAPLRHNEQLAHAARRQSLWMADQRVVRHHPTSLMARVRDTGYQASRVAENVMGPDASYQVISLALCTPEAAVAAWLRSPGHRKNLLNKQVAEVGFAYQDGYWTQIMGLRADG